jgi:LPS export ABC transporter protein LptC
MKNFLLSYWLWAVVLTVFVAIILWDDNMEENVKNAYVKHRMLLKDVNFSQVEGGFEHARMYADICDMDDNQNNMNATNIRTIFYKPDLATWTGYLIAERGLKNPFEAKFWGDVRGWNSDKERFRTEEIRYFLNRKELHTQKPVTIWKDNAILTGLGFRYNTQDKEAQINQQVVIRIWENNASETASASHKLPVSPLPVAPPLLQILQPLKIGSQTPAVTNASGPASSPIRTDKP